MKENLIIYGGDSMLRNYIDKLVDSEYTFSGLTSLIITNEQQNNETYVKAAILSMQASQKLPDAVVFISSYEVYSPDAGSMVDETRPTFTHTNRGIDYLRAEKLLEEWCGEHHIPLAILRMAHMFGKGIDGDMLRLFNRVVRGHYVHIRDNDSKLSAVTAHDAAKVSLRVAGFNGIFNISDGREHTWLELAEAMSANTGCRQRMTHLPRKWAAVIYRYLGFLPIVKETLSPEALEPVSKTLTFDNHKISEVTGMEFFDTLAVIAREEKNYPYEEN